MRKPFSGYTESGFFMEHCPEVNGRNNNEEQTPTTGIVPTGIRT